jgi:hypothetical protein
MYTKDKVKLLRNNNNNKDKFIVGCTTAWEVRRLTARNKLRTMLIMHNPNLRQCVKVSREIF